MKKNELRNQERNKSHQQRRAETLADVTKTSTEQDRGPKPVQFTLLTVPRCMPGLGEQGLDKQVFLIGKYHQKCFCLQI